jgi:tetratricopeptide (TPR) repeat protein
VFQARRTLESLLGDHPGYADAYDVMGRVLLDQGKTWQAIEALNRAITITPNCVTRLVKLGLLVFYFGDPREALAHLEQAVRQG